MIVEIAISLLLIIVLILFADPFVTRMPHGMHPFMVPMLVVLFVLFAAIVWKEAPGDERDGLHKFVASRFAYFAGITVLIVGIIVESFSGTIDPWLIGSICIILLAKLAGTLYSKLKL